MFILLSINILLYLSILFYSFKLEKKTSFHFNYLIVSCLLNVVYGILLLSQLYFPILSQIQYDIKEYILGFQFIYLLLYFSKYNIFYDRSFEKFYLFLCQLSFFITLFLMITSFTITNTLISNFFSIFNTHLTVIFLSVLVIFYLIPTLKQKKFKKEFKKLIVLFLLSNAIVLIQVISKLHIQPLIILNAIFCMIFNSHLLYFIVKFKGRYIND
jgi:hypothetical protein